MPSLRILQHGLKLTLRGSHAPRMKEAETLIQSHALAGMRSKPIRGHSDC